MSNLSNMHPRIIESIDQIQPPPVAVTKLIEILAQEFHTEDVIHILQTDPALTAAVLKRCNTAFFAQRGGVSSLNQAIQLLGTSTIMNIVLEITIGASMNGGLANYGIPPSGLRKHSICAAAAARELTKYCSILPFTPDTAFTAGLLHDIGKIAINEVLAEQEAALKDDATVATQSNIERERSLLGTDHSQVGALILTNWKFPPFFAAAIGEHHDPSLGNPLSHLIHIANWCAHSIGLSFGFQSLSDELSPESLSVMALSEANIEEAIIDTYSELNSKFKNILTDEPL
jgi:putative nucleotidyltransferase with HDIG domain